MLKHRLAGYVLLAMYCHMRDQPTIALPIEYRFDCWFDCLTHCSSFDHMEQPFA